MQVQDIDNLAPSRSQAPGWHTPLPADQRWQCLPIHWLDKYTPIDTQFSGFQVEFDAAIAIQPSNSRFQADHLPVAIMSRGQGKHLKVTIGQSIQAIELWLMSSQATTVAALDPQARCITVAQTSEPDLNLENLKYPAQKVVIDTRAASTLEIESKSPFLVTRFAIKRA